MSTVSGIGSVAAAPLRGIWVADECKTRGNKLGWGSGDSTHVIHVGVFTADQAVEVPPAALGTLSAGKWGWAGSRFESGVSPAAVEHTIQEQNRKVACNVLLITDKRWRITKFVSQVEDMVHATPRMYLLHSLRLRS